MLINAKATVATARENGSVLNIVIFLHLHPIVVILREAHIFITCSSDVYKRSRPSAVMDPVHNPEWTQSRMDTIPNGHNPERTQSRTDTIPNGLDPEWTRFQMITYIYIVTLVVYSYYMVRSLHKDKDLNKN